MVVLLLDRPLPEFLRAVMQPRPNLRNYAHGQEARAFGGLCGRDAVGNSVEERSGKHVPGAGQVLWLAGNGRYMRFTACVPHECTFRAVCHYARRHDAPELAKRFLSTGGFRYGAGLLVITKQQIRLRQRLVEWVAEQFDDERFGTGDRDFRAMLFGDANCFADRALPAGVGKEVAFGEQPFRFLDAIFIDMPRAQVAGTGQTGGHGGLGVGRDDAHAGAGSLADDDRRTDVDVEFFEFLFVKKAITVVADAADERRLAAELCQADDRIGNRPPAYQPWFVTRESR